MLYANQDLLTKHEKDVPKTWEELYETALYIMEEEKKDGNEIIAYSAEMASM